jgi:hypothetical protein
MFIRDQRLTVQLTGDTATVTIAFTVVLHEEDMTMSGGFYETVGLTGPPPFEGTSRRAALMLGGAVEPRPGSDYKELSREHTFSVPRYPAGPFTTVGFYGYIEITPVGRYDEKTTNGGVLPAKYALSAAILSVVRSVVRSFRELIGR